MSLAILAAIELGTIGYLCIDTVFRQFEKHMYFIDCRREFFNLQDMLIIKIEMPAGECIEPAFGEFEQLDKRHIKCQVWLDAASFLHAPEECFNILILLKEFLPVSRRFAIIMDTEIIEMCSKTVCKLHPFFQAELVQFYRFGAQSLNKPLLLVGSFTFQY